MITGRFAMTRRKPPVREISAILRQSFSDFYRALIIPSDSQGSDLIRPTAARATAQNYPGEIIPLQGAGSSRKRGATSFRYRGALSIGIIIPEKTWDQRGQNCS